MVEAIAHECEKHYEKYNRKECRNWIQQFSLCSMKTNAGCYFNKTTNQASS